MRATDGNSRTLFLRSSRIGWPVSTLLVSSILFVLAIGVFFIVRRAAGALTAPLPAPQLVATAAGLCVWVIVTHGLAAKRPVFFWVPLGVLLLFAVGCSFPGRRLVDWLVWMPSIGVIILLPWAARMKLRRSGRRYSSANKDNAIAEQVVQRLTRLRSSEGQDALRGTLMAEFSPGERQTKLYVGFCPPFELLPQVDVSVADESEADITLVQVLHNGAQLDVRLSEAADEPIAVTIEFFAIATK
jgi:hypothetical protein